MIGIRRFLPALVLIACLAPSRLACAHPDPLENIKIYSYILSVSPNQALVHLNRGICYRMVFDYEKAIEDFNRAEELGVKGRPLWMNRAMACLPIKRFDLAHADLSRILEEDPKEPTIYFYRGEVLFRQGRFKEAIREYSASLEVKNSHYVRFVRADAYRTIGEATAALSDYGQAISMAPQMVAYRLARARLLGGLGRFAEARADLDAAAEKQPERYQIFIDRAVLSASEALDASRVADLKLAMKFVEDELFFQPTNPAVYADRAQVHELLGEIDKARDDLNKAVELASENDSKFLRLRAAFLRRAGDSASAEADLALAAQVDARPIPTATPLPGPTLSPQDLLMQPTPNLLPELQK